MASNRRLATLSSHLVDAEANEIIVSAPTSANTKGLGLEGQVVIVTGSGQGIGEHAAKQFAREGASVVVTDLDKTKSDKVADEIKSAGGKALSVAGDVTDPKFPDHLIKQTIDHFGKINVIVNNAGYTWDGMIHKITDKQWEAMLLVHQTAPFRIVRAAAPYMRDAAKAEMDRDGVAQPRCIINISSTSGIHGNLGQANYATAKMGILGFTKTIAKEWGMFNIRSNCIAFGYIDTRLTRAKEQGEFIEVDGKKVPLGIPKNPNADAARTQAIPLQRGGRPEEAAASIVMLASPMASYVTGHCLEVTGGFGI